MLQDRRRLVVRGRRVTGQHRADAPAVAARGARQVAHAQRHRGRGQRLPDKLGARTRVRSHDAAAGQLGIITGGPAAAVARCRPLFDCMGRRTFDAGPTPAGAAVVKIANNFVLGSGAGQANISGVTGVGVISPSGAGRATITGSIQINNPTSAGGLFAQVPGVSAGSQQAAMLAVEYRQPICMMIGLLGHDPSTTPRNSPRYGVRIIEPILDAMGIPHHLINEDADVAKIRPAIEDAYAASHPVALLIGRRPSAS